MKLSIEQRRFFREYQPLLRQIVVLLVIFFGTIFGIIPAIQSSINLFGQQSTVQKDMNDLSDKMNILNSQSSESLKSDLFEMSAAVPTTTSVPTLFVTLEGVSGQSGVSLLNVSLSGGGSLSTESAQKSPAHSSGAKAVQFSALIDGPIENVLQFFETIGRVRRFMGIKSFDLALGVSGNVQAKIEMESYFAPLSIGAASAQAKLSPLSTEEEEVIAKVAALPNLTQATELPPPSIGIAKPDPFAP